MINRLRSRRKRPNIQEAEEFLIKGFGGGMRAPDYISIAERKEYIEQFATQLNHKLLEHLPKARNLELVILKCHLLIEFVFDQYINLMAPITGAVENERFSFKQKEYIVHMLGFPPDPIFFASVDLLNMVRNQIAHNLSFDRSLVKKLIAINSEDSNTSNVLSDSQMASAIKNITKFLCGQMLGIIKGIHEAEEFISPST